MRRGPPRQSAAPAIPAASAAPAAGSPVAAGGAGVWEFEGDRGWESMAPSAASAAELQFRRSATAVFEIQGVRADTCRALSLACVRVGAGELSLWLATGWFARRGPSRTRSTCGI